MTIMTHHADIAWHRSGEYADIRYETTDDGIAKITICRPEVHNAFRPQTLIELSDALVMAPEDVSFGLILLTGDCDKSFSFDGDPSVDATTSHQLPLPHLCHLTCPH